MDSREIRQKLNEAFEIDNGVKRFYAIKKIAKEIEEKNPDAQEVYPKIKRQVAGRREEFFTQYILQEVERLKALEPEEEPEKDTEQELIEILDNEELTEAEKIRQLFIKLISTDIEDQEEKFLITSLLRDVVVNSEDRFKIILNLLSGDEKIYTLSPKFLSEIVEAVVKIKTGEVIETQGSDEELIKYIDQNEITDVKVEVVAKSSLSGGGFFDMVHTLDGVDLSDLQIYRSAEEAKKKIDSHCLINCFKILGVDVKKLNVLIRENEIKPIKKMDLANIAAKLDVRIILTDYSDEMQRISTYSYNKVSANIVKILLFRGHYMPAIKLHYSPFFIKNYENMQSFGNCTSVVKTRTRNGKIYPVYSDKAFTVAKILKTMVETGRFQKNNKIAGLNPKIDLSTLEIDGITIEEEQKLLSMSEVSQNDTENVYSCDFESDVSNSDRVHRPIMLGCVNHKSGAYREFITASSGKDQEEVKIFKDMLNEIIRQKTEFNKGVAPKKNKFILYFHNLKYDYTIFRACPNVTGRKKIVKNGQLYAYSFTYKDNIFTMKDSYKIISMKLDDFGDSLGIDQKKIKFDLYDAVTTDMITKREPICTSLIKKYESYVKKDEFQFYNYMNDYIKITPQFNPLTKKIEKKETFDVVKCYRDYLKVDCIVLMKGLEKFRVLVSDVMGLDIHSFLTIGSMVHRYFYNKEIYNGVYQVSGALQNFLMQGVVGGRVFNYEPKTYNFAIEDFDACSLYPSAMSISSFPLGKCKFLTPDKLNMDFLNSVDHYVVKVMLKLNKTLQIPIYQEKDENGVRQWTNTATRPTVMSKIAIEDMLNHYNADIIQIYEGVYWDEGVTTDVQPLISELYESRKIYKKKGNKPMADLYKLILNSSYGKTLLKPADENIRLLNRYDYKNNEKTENKNKFDKFVSKNFFNIIDITTTKNNWEIRTKKIDLEHSNLAHIGMIILDNSKKIMNNVLSVANDNDIPVFYTDTDSIHMPQKDVSKLEEHFNNWAEKNDWPVKKLIGEDLLQFHCDFESQKLGKGVWSKKFIACGKKCYLDVLTNGTDAEDYHIRFKGMKAASIIHYCELKGINLAEFFEKINRGDFMAVDICQGKNVVSFEYKDSIVRTRSSFIKVINPPKDKDGKKITGQKLKKLVAEHLRI